jgi:hypothetical protein
MKSKIFSNISKFFSLGSKKRRNPNQEEVQPETTVDKEGLIDALHLREDNPWYFAGEKAKEANFLTKLHFATGPKMMQKKETRSRWAWNNTEQQYRPEAVNPNRPVEVWNDQYRLGTEAGVPIEIQMMEAEEQDSKLKKSEIARAMNAATQEEPLNTLMTQEVPTGSETMEIPPPASDEQQQLPAAP